MSSQALSCQGAPPAILEAARGDTKLAQLLSSAHVSMVFSPAGVPEVTQSESTTATGKGPPSDLQVAPPSAGVPEATN